MNVRQFVDSFYRELTDRCLASVAPEHHRSVTVAICKWRVEQTDDNLSALEELLTRHAATHRQTEPVTA